MKNIITNGDMFLKTYPNSKVEEVSNIKVTVDVGLGYFSADFDKDWWEAPYNEE